MSLFSKRKFHSMRHQIAALFIGVMILSMAGITVLNGVFLEKYYLHKKVEVLVQAQKMLNEYYAKTSDQTESTDDTSNDSESEVSWGAEEDEEAAAAREELARESFQSNLTWVVSTADESPMFYGYGEKSKAVSTKLLGYIYGLDSDLNNAKALRTDENAVFQQVTDRQDNNTDYVECWGTLDNGYYYLIRTPLESIRESVEISNTFYLFVAVIIVLLSTVVISFYARRITKPISELTQLSQEMSSLNFDTHYTSRAGNEIDVLGDSFNRMSMQLEQTVSELKSANLRLQADIEDKIKIDEMRKEFLDNVSHELKTPIALIQGYAEGLKENINDDPESQEFYVEVIMDEAAKMNKLVKNLLTLNQLEHGKDTVMMERFDIVEVIRGVLESMQIMIEQNEAQIHFTADKPVYVWGDEFKIEEVLTNYISNALHHIGGDRAVAIRIQEEDGRVRVGVFNNGTPIPEKDLPNLWTKFYKVDKARTREYGGSGIGLSIVKAIMESMNQEYGVTNYNNGVEFYFTLDRR